MSEYRTIATKCPICDAILPIFSVTLQRHGFLGRHTRLLLDGDATDYVAHMWQHSQEKTWP